MQDDVLFLLAALQQKQVDNPSTIIMVVCYGVTFSWQRHRHDPRLFKYAPTESEKGNLQADGFVKKQLISDCP